MVSSSDAEAADSAKLGFQTKQGDDELSIFQSSSWCEKSMFPFKTPPTKKQPPTALALDGSSSSFGETEEEKMSKGIFKMLDKDGDERVSCEELMVFLCKLNLDMPLEHLESTVTSFSKDGQDSLTPCEFGEFVQHLMTDREHHESCNCCYDSDVLRVFSVFDKNGDGLISTEELAEVMWRLGYLQAKNEQVCKDMIQRVDSNGDGFVDIYEFKNLMSKVPLFSSPAQSPSSVLNF